MSLRVSSICAKDPKDPKTTNPHQLPIYATSSFEFESIDEGIDIFRNPDSAHIYGRFGNPTVDAVANKIASLEALGTNVNDEFGIMTSSGLSAITTLVLTELRSGDKILTQGNLYGGTTELLKNTLSRSGIDVVLTDLSDLAKVDQILSQEKDIKALYLETPSNPLLDCVDLESLGNLAKSHSICTIIDNTFCTPILQQPFKYGIDYIVHSTTKYLNGHGNVISGVIVGKGKKNRDEVWKTMKLLGTNGNPFDAWLVNQGMKTLTLRMDRHNSNAMALSQYLESHPKIERVYYLGLPSHKYHSLAKKQMTGYTGMMCFEVKGGFDEGVAFMNAQTMGALAPTLGDVDTLIMHPASMSHLNVSKEIRERNGIKDSLIRVSVGIEDVKDIIEDFDRALG